jgi:5-methylcytosine-specific restriction endonuclease McrA
MFAVWSIMVLLLLHMGKEKEAKKKGSKKRTPPKKTKSKNIPKRIRSIVWDTYLGPHEREGKCLSCNDNIIKLEDFACGHIIAKANGGTEEIENLRPICSACNSSMYTTNMDDFVVQFGLVRHENWHGIGAKVEAEKKVEKKVEVVGEEIVEKEVINNPLQCKDCGKVFSRSDHFNNHFKRKNPCIPKSKTCEFCNTTFSTLSSLTRHLKDYCLKEEEQYYKNTNILAQLHKLELQQEQLMVQNIKIEENIKREKLEIVQLMVEYHKNADDIKRIKETINKTNIKK